MPLGVSNFNGSSKGHCAGVFASVYVLIAHNQKVGSQNDTALTEGPEI